MDHVSDLDDMSPEEFDRLAAAGEPVRLARVRPRSVFRETTRITSVVGAHLTTRACAVEPIDRHVDIHFEGRLASR